MLNIALGLLVIALAVLDMAVELLDLALELLKIMVEALHMTLELLDELAVVLGGVLLGVVLAAREVSTIAMLLLLDVFKVPEDEGVVTVEEEVFVVDAPMP